MLGFKPKELLLALLLAVSIFLITSFVLFKSSQLGCLDFCTAIIGFPLPFAGKITSIGPVLSTYKADFDWHYNWILLTADILIFYIATLLMLRGLQKHKILTIGAFFILVIFYFSIPLLILGINKLNEPSQQMKQQSFENRMKYLNEKQLQK